VKNTARKKTASVSKKRKAKLSPKGWYIRKGPVYSANMLAAKVYLQNGRVVIPNYKDYQNIVPEERPRKKSRSRSKSNR